MKVEQDGTQVVLSLSVEAVVLMQDQSQTPNHVLTLAPVASLYSRAAGKNVPRSHDENSFHCTAESDSLGFFPAAGFRLSITVQQK